MTNATFGSGIGIAALMAAASAEPNGSQKLKYAADVAALLGVNPIFRIRVGGTVVYQSTVSGTLPASSVGIVVPSQFVEPASTNVAQLAGNISHPVLSGTWPRHAMPGGYGRYKLVTTTPQLVTSSPLRSSNTVGKFPPWGNYDEAWEYQYEDWVMSIQQFRDNPPPPLVT